MRGDYIQFYGDQRHYNVLCKRCSRLVAEGFNTRGSISVIPNEHYSEVELVMQEPEGQLSKHQSVLCASCAPEITELEMDALYQADITSWGICDVMGGHRVEDIIPRLIRQAMRRPISVRGVCWPHEELKDVVSRQPLSG